MMTVTLRETGWIVNEWEEGNLEDEEEWLSTKELLEDIRRCSSGKDFYPSIWISRLIKKIEGKIE